MKITNKLNLSPALYNALSESWRPDPKRMRVTQLIRPPLVRHLLLTRWDDIVVDAVERIWAVDGTAWHAWLDKFAPANSLSEERLFLPLWDDIVLTGRPDIFYPPPTPRILDYKKTSVWAYIFGEHDEWEQQMNIYNFMFHRHGFKVEMLQVEAFFRDWHQADVARKHGYPPHPISHFDIPMWPLNHAETFIYSRMELHKSGGLIPCTMKERFGKGEVWKVMKEGRKTAVKNFDNEDDARIFQQKKGGEHYIKYQAADYVRCRRYCEVRTVCPHNPYLGQKEVVRSEEEE